MYKYENDCVGCPPEMGCLGSLCPERHNMILTCDRCGSDTDILYIRNGEELCQDCLENELDIRDYDDIPHGDPICHSCTDTGGKCNEETFVYSEEDEEWICESEYLKDQEQMNVEDAEREYGEEHEEDGF